MNLLARAMQGPGPKAGARDVSEKTGTVLLETSVYKGNEQGMSQGNNREPE